MSIDGAPDGGEGNQFMKLRTDSVFFGADGTGSVEFTAASYNMSQDEIREAAAEATGLDPDKLDIEHLGEVSADEPLPPPSGRNKATASFGAWNSPWRPGEQPPGDPSLN